MGVIVAKPVGRSNTIISGSGGDSFASYLVLNATGSLVNERVFTTGTGLSASDGGSGNPYTLSIDDSVVATISGSTFTGPVLFNAGLSGSLTQLVDGTSYLVAGNNVTINSASNGQITISVDGGGVTSKNYYAVTASHPANQNLEVGFTINSSAFDTDDVNVHLNGALLRSGSNFDTYLGTTSTSLRFTFLLYNRDLVTVQTFE